MKMILVGLLLVFGSVAMAEQQVSLYEKWDLAFKTASPAHLRHFPRSPTERPSFECSDVITKDSTKMKYIGNVACHVEFSSPVGSFNGILFVPKDYPISDLVTEANHEKIASLLSTVRDLQMSFSDDATQGIQIRGLRDQTVCETSWRVKQGLLISKQKCPQNPNHSGFVICKNLSVSKVKRAQDVQASSQPAPSFSGPVFIPSFPRRGDPCHGHVGAINPNGEIVCAENPRPICGGRVGAISSDGEIICSDR